MDRDWKQQEFPSFCLLYLRLPFATKTLLLLPQKQDIIKQITVPHGGRQVSEIKKLTILHSNDLHGDFLEEEVDERLIGGVSRLSGYVNQVRQ